MVHAVAKTLEELRKEIEPKNSLWVQQFLSALGGDRSALGPTIWTGNADGNGRSSGCRGRKSELVRFGSTYYADIRGNKAGKCRMT